MTDVTPADPGPAERDSSLLDAPVLSAQGLTRRYRDGTDTRSTSPDGELRVRGCADV